ncbi:ATP-dependent DNA helicase UvrD/PcrA [Mycoplasmopsis californica]|uniref:DNA 3'-5' helicase n=1 Tax=Mycoplasmopsis equigenitalium TaxID=114883 RepID=A0ABY5J0G3_9BACT|nr:UvrD-helicase domain-containing protein [Mycoplasmopsis equigenitalium]UUD36748.1 UvrD-helicase domain-containing protein [Mycoplasmopsis equigenitalium]VEU69958.1 ATP-dependent DNA helicase UvrD/PcrA [Mycoplasmopsis californica]
MNEITNIEKKLTEDLNPQQLASVLYDKGPLRIIASAGSGKTKVLTRKVAYLIKVIGVSPNRILAITFTNRAANEMKTRISSYLSDDVEVFATTFHALCARILRIDIDKIGRKKDFHIVDKKDLRDILKRIYDRLEINDNVIPYSDMSDFIHITKIKNIDLNDYVEKNKHNVTEVMKVSIFEEYQKTLLANNALDFHDLLLTTKFLFETKPEIRDKWAHRFDYVLVDEFQDTNEVQYDIIKVIAENAKITIVGDPDQTIYSWRGAKVDLMLNFDKEFKDTKTVTLNQNYRSTKRILAKANSLIKHNKNRLDKELVTENPEGDEPEFFHAFSPQAEALWVIKKINELKKAKNQLKSIAIFYRSNYYSRPFEEALIKENINHKIFGGERFFERKEVKDALAFLRAIYDGNNISFNRIINVPPRELGTQTQLKILDYANIKKKNVYDCVIEHINDAGFPVRTKSARRNLAKLIRSIQFYREALKTNRISVVLDKFLQEIGYYQQISGVSNLRGSAMDNIRELLESIEEWEKNNADKNVADYLESISLLSSSNDENSVNNYVSLMTIHAAKGLQFDNVFIVGLSDEIFPSRKSSETDTFSTAKEKMEEERRLAYVAITRAKKRLFLSDSRGTYYNSNRPKRPSKFLKEMGIKVNSLLPHNLIPAEDITQEIEVVLENREVYVNDIISHSTFGEGVVVDVNNDTIDVKFNNKKFGKKTLMKSHMSFQVLKRGNDE